MTTTACISEGNLYERHVQISEGMIGSRRGNPSEVHVPATTRAQPQPTIDLTTPVVETAFIVDSNVNEQTILVAESRGLASKTFSSGYALLDANIEHQEGCIITELWLPDMHVDASCCRSSRCGQASCLPSF